MASVNVTDPAFELDPAENNPYGYVPTLWVCITFIALFGVSTFAHTVQSFYFRMRWLLPTASLAGIMEVIGWSARLWSSINPANHDPFIMQISVTIMAPSPLVGALFICFEKVLVRLGEQYSRLRPQWYTRIFLTCDVISLITQGVGGGLAGSADSGDREQVDLGGNIMLGGIVFQMVSITVFVALMVEYFIRYMTDRPVRQLKNVAVDASVETLTPPGRGELNMRMQLMILGIWLNTLFLFIRSVYRTIELIDGFDGKITQTQIYFNIFDGAMIVLAMYTLNLLHPGWLLGHRSSTAQTYPMSEGKVIGGDSRATLLNSA
ncbi:RTA1-domain-containing protein [Earliella scabrosa]|nr:RTA1-domain-containing protein [Earliella scabrosa]